MKVLAVQIPDDLHRELRIKAATENSTLKSIVLEAIERYVA
jgi:hypothetical protein